MTQLFRLPRIHPRKLSVAFLLVFLAGCFVLVPHVKGGTSYGKVKPHFAVLINPVVNAVEPMPGSLAKTSLPDWSYQYSGAAISSTIIFLYKAFFISAYERNLFYVYTSINAP